MPLTELDKTWRITSSGTPSTHVGGNAVAEWTFHIVTGAGSTATVEIQAFADTASTSAGVVMGSSQALASSGGEHLVLQFTGPMGAVAPRVVHMTSTGIVVVRAIGV